MYSINQTQYFTNVREVSFTIEHFHPNIDIEHFPYEIVYAFLGRRIPFLQITRCITTNYVY